MDGGQLIGVLTIIGFDLNQPFQIVRLIRIKTVLALPTNRQHFSLIGALIRRQKLWLFRSAVISKTVENASSWTVYGSVPIHIFYLVATMGGLWSFILFLGGEVLLDLYFSLSIFLLELFIAHLNEHVVVDFVRSAALKFPRDS